MLEEPMRILLPLATELETADAADLDIEAIVGFEKTLLRLSGAIAERFFQQGANASPPRQATGLA